MRNDAMHPGAVSSAGRPWALTSPRPVLRTGLSSTHRQTRHRQARYQTVVSSSGKANAGIGFLNWAGAVIPQGTVVKGVKTGWKLTWETMMRELAPQNKNGEYTRPSYSFASWISNAPGAEFPAESGRYAVYVGNACPWCHRICLTIALRGLGEHVKIIKAVDDAERASRGGWVFDSPEPVFGGRDLREVYDAASPGYTGRCTAPLLVDTKARRLVNNESSEIMRMLNSLHFPGCTEVDLLPSTLIGEIDALNDEVYRNVNNGVYRSGFATTQAAYDKAQGELYGMLDQLEETLSRSRFLLGDKITEADLRLFPTIVRFDAAYTTLFKCSRRRIADYPNLSLWMRDIWQLPIPGQKLQVSSTFSVDEARRSYFGQLFPLNPGGIIPAGPTVQLGVAGRLVHRRHSAPASIPSHWRGPSDHHLLRCLDWQDLRLNEPAGRGPTDDLSSITHSRAEGSSTASSDA